MFTGAVGTCVQAVVARKFRTMAERKLEVLIASSLVLAVQIDLNDHVPSELAHRHGIRGKISGPHESQGQGWLAGTGIEYEGIDVAVNVHDPLLNWIAPLKIVSLDRKIIDRVDRGIALGSGVEVDEERP